ncbi:hypothetical protein MRX96_007266 [Rhipicephalus microplus]
MTDHGFETLEISEGSSFEGGCSFQDQTSDDDQNGTDAGSLSRVTEPLPLLLLQTLNSDVRHWKPQSERESDDDEENVNEEESSSDDEDMPAHWRRIAVSINSKLTVQGASQAAWKPG